MITSNDCKKLRELTGIGMKDCKELLIQYETIDNVLAFLKSQADVPEFVGTGKIQYDVFKNGKLVFTCNSDKELQTFNPSPKWYATKDYSVRVLGGDGKYSYLKFK